MSTRDKAPPAPPHPVPSPGPPAPRAWAKLAALGALSALWSLFLWTELVLSRSGGGSFCGFGGKLDCAEVWNDALASAAHRLTGLPIAGWGLVWSVTAFALPLAGLARLAEGKSVAALTSAVRLTAAARNAPLPLSARRVERRGSAPGWPRALSV